MNAFPVVGLAKGVGGGDTGLLNIKAVWGNVKVKRENKKAEEK